VQTCVHCGGAARIVAAMDVPTANWQILDLFDKHGALEHAHDRPAPRAPRGGA